MKKRIWMLAFLAIAAAAAGQSGNLVPQGAYCLHAGTWIPVAASYGAAAPESYPLVALYGLSGTTWYPLACDAYGNLSAGSILGVTVPALAPGFLYYSANTGSFGWAPGGGPLTVSVNGNVASTATFYVNGDQI